MYDEVRQIFCIFVILATLKVMHVTALTIGCHASFVRRVTYNGVVPDEDEDIYIDSVRSNAVWTAIKCDPPV
jgi:hypothetical protein